MPFPFLDELEKIIVEHGSAVVTKERLELAKEKYSMLELQHKHDISVLKSDIASLQTNCQNLLRENEAYKNDLSQAEENIKNLRNIISKHNQYKNLIFDKQYGVWKDPTNNLYYCPKCKAIEKLSPLQPCQSDITGFYCPVCDQSFWERINRSSNYSSYDSPD